MSAVATNARARGRARMILALSAAWGCVGEGGNATAPTDLSRLVASIAVGAVTEPVLAGDTIQLVSVARDESGRVLDRVTVRWGVSDESIASIDARGRLIGVGHGDVTVTATAGRAVTSASLPVRLTAEDRRFAYAWVQDPTTSTSYRPAAAHQQNATGGDVSVARRGVGEYIVTFERMAKVDGSFRETVLVTAGGSSGERCHLNGWTDAANGRDLDVSVSCFSFAGTRVDSRFSVLVVGSRSLPSRLGFTVTGDATSAFAPQSHHTFSSFSEGVGVSRSTAGSYLVRLAASAGASPQNYFVSTFGGGDDLCKVSSWNRDVWATVVCYGPSGALVDARFSLLTLESGRPGRRFGFAWSNDPSTPVGGSYTPSLDFQRTSSGLPVRVFHPATGAYLVSFPGLAKAGTRPETVHVSSYGGGLFTCQVEGWANSADGSALDAAVRCWNRGNGAPADTYFTILVLE